MIKKRATATARVFVLDSSVIAAWFFEDEVNAYAESVANALSAASAAVPSLWPLEVANALFMGERRKRTTMAKVTQFLCLLKGLPITLDDETAVRAWQESLHLARTFNLSVYDAAYLELAQRRGLPLASLDRALKAAAAIAGIKEYKP